MGIVVSVPQNDGLVSVSPPSSTISSTSSILGPIRSINFGVSSTILSQNNTHGTIVIAVPVSQTSGALPADVTDAILIDDPTSREYAETFAAHLSTMTVTSKIKVTNLVTTTATVVVSHCPTTAASSTIQSVPSTRMLTTSAVRAPTDSSLPADFHDYDISSFSVLPEDGAHISESSSFTLPSLSVVNASSYSRTTHSELHGSGAGSSQNSTPTYVLTPTMNASTLRIFVTGVSKKNSSSLLSMSELTPIATVWPTGSPRSTFKSRSEQRKDGTGGHDDAQQNSEQTLSFSGSPLELTYLTRVADIQKHRTKFRQINLHSTTALTKTKDVTTTIIYTTDITKHTITTTVTVSSTGCPSRPTSTSTPASATSCASATLNPKPPANDTCAEDGLLEYSNTLQPPNTLEGCALACLADASCLSFTFIPNQKTCYTSLYPLADSAYAGLQEYSIYNYDRGCYDCSG